MIETLEKKARMLTSEIKKAEHKISKYHYLTDEIQYLRSQQAELKNQIAHIEFDIEDIAHKQELMGDVHAQYDALIDERSDIHEKISKAKDEAIRAGYKDSLV